MNNYLIGASLVLGSTIVAAISQVMLKIATQQTYKSWIFQYLNPRVIFAYGLFFVTTITSILAIRFIPLSLASALDASGQVFVLLLSRLVLKEQISRRKCLGIIIIVAGIIMFWI